ncbi:MAG: glycosyltransferase [Thermofilum sp.]|nr:glycosyltransferase [Thermofilum sp.]
MIKIGIVLGNPLSEGLGFGLRPRMLIKYLALVNDVEVHVYTPFHENMADFKNVYFHKLKTLFENDYIGKAFYNISRKMVKNPFFAKNLMYRSFTLNRIIRGLAQSLKKELQKHPVDVLQAEQDIVAAAAVLTKKSVDVPVIADILDLWVDEEILAGRIKPFSHAFNAINDITKIALLESDLVLVGNNIIKNILLSRYSLDPQKIAISPNGGELLDINLEKPRKRRVIYAGNFEPYEYVDLFIQASSYILKADNSIEISIFGKGPDEKRLRKLAKEIKLPNSIFKGYIPREKLIPILMESSVGVVPTKKEYATPMKPFEYLSAGLPIVSIKGMWWTEVIEKYNAGISSNFEPEEFAEAILTLINSRDIKHYSKNAIEVIRREYNWNIITEKLVSEYFKLV